MALSFKVGSVTLGSGGSWSSADAVNATFATTGLGFQPKGLILFLNGNNSDNFYKGVGFVAGTGDRRCMAVTDVNAAGSQDCAAVYRADACVAITTQAGVVDGLLDLSSFDSGGFTLIVDDALSASHAVAAGQLSYIAWGGTDITDVGTVDISEPATATTVSYIVGTGAGFLPSVAFFAGTQLTSVPSVAEIDAAFMFGAATGTGAGNQFVIVGNADEGAANCDADGYTRGDECLAMIAAAGGNPNARAAFNGFDSEGFDLSWTTRATTGRRYMGLAIKGGSWKVGTYNINTQTTNNTATVSGLSFQPIGGLNATTFRPESTAGTATANQTISIGAWESTTSRRTTIQYQNHDGQGTMIVQGNIDGTVIARLLNSAGSLTCNIDLDAVNSDGFRVIVDLGSGVSSSDQQGYVVFANAPEDAAKNTRPAPLGVNIGMEWRM